MSAPAPGLRRTLTLWDAVFYGIVLVQPVAPMGIFGVVSQEARGHVITTILIGMFAMLLTAMSYGRMARVYPSAGSAFAYVGQELHPGLGYVTGWSMVMDYVLNPMICTIFSGVGVTPNEVSDPVETRTDKIVNKKTQTEAVKIVSRAVRNTLAILISTM